MRITRSVMATLHACRRSATPNKLTPEPQIEIWGYSLPSFRDSKVVIIMRSVMATNLPSLRDSKMTRGRWGKGDSLQGTGFGVRCEVAGDSSEEAE